MGSALHPHRDGLAWGDMERFAYAFARHHRRRLVQHHLLPLLSHRIGDHERADKDNLCQKN